MCRTRLLILLLFLGSITGCGYSFVLDSGTPTIQVTLEHSVNQTPLREAGMVLDASLEEVLSSMGMLKSADDNPTLRCTLVSTSRQTITSTSLSSNDRYRLVISVSAELTDTQGKRLWKARFSDDGTYAEGGQPEDALDEACSEVSLQIARAIATLSL